MNQKYHQNKFTYYVGRTLQDLTLRLDPQKIEMIAEYHALHNLTIQMTLIDNDRSLVPYAALKVEVAPDAKSVQVKLRPDLYFSDGTKITCNDVVGTFRRLARTGTSHTDLKSFMSSSTPVTLLSDTECVINFSRPVKEVRYYLQLADWGILHKSQYEKIEPLTLDDWQVSSGPYRVEKSDAGYHLVANSHYKLFENIPTPIRFEKNLSAAEIIDKLKKSEIDFGSIPFRTAIEEILPNPGRYQQYRFEGSKFGFNAVLLLNSSHPNLRDVSERQRIRDLIRDKFQVPTKYGDQIVKSNTYFIPDSPLANLGDLPLPTAQATNAPKDGQKKKIRIERVNPKTSTISIAEIDDLIQTALASAFDIEFYKIPADDAFHEEIKSGRIQGFISYPSMSYFSAAESLNLLYMSSVPKARDPSGKIKGWIRELGSTINDPLREAQIIKQIAQQMHEDAEVIPLYFFGNYKFYLKDRLDGSNVSFWESHPFFLYKQK